MNTVSLPCKTAKFVSLAVNSGDQVVNVHLGKVWFSIQRVLEGINQQDYIFVGQHTPVEEVIVCKFVFDYMLHKS
jgi:hypothetical protein